MKNMRLFTCLLASLAMLAESNAQFSFTNRTSWLNSPSSFTSGVAVAVADINNDGKDDIVRLKNGNELNVEYQQGSGQPFSHLSLGTTTGQAWALAVADANNDGYSDLYFGGYYDDAKFYKAINNGTNFQPTFLPGVGLFAQGSNFADIDNDGWLDIFSCHDDGLSRIWGNDGAGSFTSNDNWINMATVPSSDNSGNYGSTWTDFDNDGDTDLYIAKCRGGASSPTDPRRINALFVNDGNGNYTEAAGTYGLKIGWQSWSADFQDIDNDGDFDCLVTNHDNNLQLLRNDGTGHFTDISTAAGLGSQMGNFYQGLMRDFNNDGFVDIITASPSVFYKNNGNGTFTSVTSNPFSGMNSLAVGDLNHDGFMDVYAAYQCGIVSSCNVPDKLWINNGNNNHYLAVNLQGTTSNRKGVGARVEIHGAWGKQVREIRSGESYGISNSLSAHFGIGTATQIDYLVVHWPSGMVDVVANPAPDQYLTIEEGSTNFCGSLAVNATPTAALVLPDAQSTNFAITCGGGNANVQLSLCNQGSGTLPTNLPVALYLNDPRLPGATLLMVANTNQPVAPGSCYQFTTTLNTALLTGGINHQIFIVANDDGTTPLPFAQTPASLTGECGNAPNITSTQFQHQVPVLDLGPDLSLCNTPSATLTASNGFETYLWQNGATTPSISASQTGSYMVLATDNCGFQRADFVQVTLTQAAPIELGSDQSICAGESVNLAVTGYTSVQWTPQPGLSCTVCASATATPTTTTTYQVSATNGACQSSDQVQITVNAPPGLSLVQQAGNCGQPASLTAMPTGSGPFGYAWSNGEATATIFPQQSGSYTVVATDANGCEASAAAQATVFSSLQSSTSTTPPTCASSANGSIDLTVTGGNGPFSFLWSNQATTEDLTGIAAGNYTATITDANQCISVASVSLTGPQPLVAEAVPSVILCNGSAGSVQLNIGGGTPGYTYAWSNGAASQNLSDVPAGSYTVQITDANQCTTTASTSLTAPAALTASSSATPISCSTSSPGQATLSAQGGTAPYGFLWQNGQTSASASFAQPGSYSATITDANGCQLTSSATIGLSGLLELSASQTPISCHPANGSSNDGTLSVTATSGFAPYGFLWQNGATSPDLTDLGPGSYTVTVSDAAGCSGTLGFVLDMPTAVSLSVVSEGISCFGQGNGSVFATASGGTAPFSFSWSDGQMGNLVIALSGGLYSVIATDANGCTATAAVTVASPTEALTAQLAPLADYCSSAAATASVSATGGTPPYAHAWSNGDTGSTATGFVSGSYSVSTTDANGCSVVTAFEMTISAADTTEYEVAFCQGEASPVTGTVYEDAGEYSEQLLLSNQAGCDSLLIGQVTVHPEELIWADNGPLPYGTLYHGVILTQDTQFVLYDTTQFGCLLTISENVEVSPSATDEAAELLGLLVSPNPFTDQLQLLFTLPKQMTVSIALYDALGRELRVLVAQQALGAGEHQMKWDGLKLPPGVYGLQLRADGIVASRKMVRLGN